MSVGEIVAWIARRLDFGAVQRRGLSSPARAAALAEQVPVSYGAFDVLALAGDDTRPWSYTRRRDTLVAVLAPLGPPLQPVLATTDRDQAIEWYEHLVPVGVEGLVTKPLHRPYRPGRASGWYKVRHTAATDAEVIATGPGARPVTARVRLRATGAVVQAVVPERLRDPFAAALAQAGDGSLVVEVRTGTGRHTTTQITRVRSDA